VPPTSNENSYERKSKAEVITLPQYFYGDGMGLLPKSGFYTPQNTYDGDYSCPQAQLNILSDIQLTSVTYRETSFWMVG